MWFARRFSVLVPLFIKWKSERSLTVGLVSRSAMFPSPAGRRVGGEGLSRRRPSPQPSPSGGGSVTLGNQRVAESAAGITKPPRVQTFAPRVQAYAARVQTFAARRRTFAAQAQAYAAPVRALRPRVRALTGGQQAAAARVHALTSRVRALTAPRKAQSARASAAGVRVETRPPDISPRQGEDKSPDIDQRHSRGQRPSQSINHINWGPRHRARAPKIKIGYIPRATLRSPWAILLRASGALTRRPRASNQFVFISEAFRNHALRVITSQSLFTFHTTKGESR